MDPIPFSRLLIGYGLMFGLPLSLFLFPRTWWARFLNSNVGPDLDVTHQSRADCLRSSGVFAVLGLTGLAAAFGTGAFAEAWFGAVDRVLPIAALAFAYMLLGFLGLGGALYLLARAPFRPATIAIPRPPTPVKTLKRYQSRDGTYGVMLCVTPDDQYVVLVPEHMTASGRTEPQALGPFATIDLAEQAALAASGHIPSTGV